MRKAKVSRGGGALSTVERLIAQKDQLSALLHQEPAPNEREEIERSLSKIETALTWLSPADPRPHE
jgi:hypothetical protein